MNSERTKNINPTLSSLLAECALNAYTVNNQPKPPSGYHFYQELWAKNPSDFGGDTEKYGVIFQNKQNTKDFIIAFKGTTSFWDKYEDLWFFEQVPFQNYINVNTNINIAYGANSIYTSATDNNKDSLQVQLFQFIQDNDIENLYITGHSLGSALSEVFTLDYYFYFLKNHNSRKKIKITNYNFACPRIGDKEFCNVYNDFEKSKNFGLTLRIVNYMDHIPLLAKGFNYIKALLSRTGLLSYFFRKRQYYTGTR